MKSLAPHQGAKGVACAWEVLVSRRIRWGSYRMTDNGRTEAPAIERDHRDYDPQAQAQWWAGASPVSRRA